MIKKAITGPRKPKSPIENPDNSDPHKNIPERDPQTKEIPEIDPPPHSDPSNGTDTNGKIVFIF